MKSLLILLVFVVKALAQVYEPQQLGALNQFVFTTTTPRAFQYEVSESADD